MSGESGEGGGGGKPAGYVYTIRERPGQKPIWTRIGAVWTNKDMSLNGVLNAVPLNGRFTIRAPREDEAEDEAESA